MPDSVPQLKPAHSPSRLRRRFGRGGMALLLLLTLVTGACIHRTLDGPKPWDKEVAKREAEAKALRAREHGIKGVWWGCAISAALGGMLLVTAPLWMPGGPNTPRRPSRIPTPTSSAFYLGLFLVLGAGVMLRAPQLTHSLWNDEEYALRRYIHGDWTQQPAGGIEFQKVSWDDTLFHNFNGNNHLLQSALSRLSLDAWHFLRGTPEEAFSELVVRLPSFIAGIFTLVCIALIGVEIGKASIGFGAAALLTLHPWHVRYAVEARGYSLMLLFMAIAILALLHALRRDKGASWLAFALAQAAFLLCFAGSVYVAVAMNLLAVWEILRRRETRRLRTLIGFNLLSAIPVLIWMLPSVPQLVEFLRRETVLNTPIGIAWARDIGSHLAAGILYENDEPARHLGTSWISQQTHPLWQPLLVHTLPIAALSGLFMALFSPPASRLALLSLLLGGLLAVTHNLLSGQSMLSWYLLYLILPLCLAIPIACHDLLPWSDKTAAPAILLIVALYAVATQDVRSRFVHHDRQPIRQAAASYRPDHPAALAAVFGVSDRQFQSYDPRAIVVENPASFESLISQARQDKRPFFAILCGRTATLSRQPDITRRVIAGSEFEPHATLPGLEAMFSYEVWRLKPAP